MDEDKQNLAYPDMKGWVKVNDHLILLEWDPQYHPLFPMSSSDKAFCERISAEEAIMKGETEVLIRWAPKGILSRWDQESNLMFWNRGVHRRSREGRRRKQQQVWYDPHISVKFVTLDRYAYIYVGPGEAENVQEMRIWRREGKPAVVLCWLGS